MMTYIRGGKKVSKEEFLEGARGWDFSRPAGFQASFFTPFQSPIDGRMINNHRELSAHNRDHNVHQVGHEYEKVVNENRLKNKENQ